MVADEHHEEDRAGPEQHVRGGAEQLASNREPVAELETTLPGNGRQQDQGTGAQGQRRRRSQLARPNRPPLNRTREVEAQPAFGQIATDDRGAQDQRQSEAEADGQCQRRAEPDLGTAPLFQPRQPGSDERNQSQQERRHDQQPPLGNLALEDGKKAPHRSSSSPVRAMKISSSVSAVTSGSPWSGAPAGHDALKRSSS